MKIISLTAENILRLTAVSIDFKNGITEVTGKNSAGKSSCIESIWMALGGEKAIPSVPIHDGSEAGHISLSLGEDDGVSLKVSRKIRAKEGGGYTTSLTVENAEGARFQKPQEILNSLIGGLSYDPLDFLKKKPAEKFELLRGFVPDVDFDGIERANKADYDERTAVNRRVRELRAQEGGIVIAADAPKSRVDESALVAKLEQAGETNASVEKVRAEVAATQGEIARRRSAVDTALKRAADLRKQADDAEASALDIQAEADRLDEYLAAQPPVGAKVDTSALLAGIESARRSNIAFDRHAASSTEKARLAEAAAAAEANALALTARIEERTKQKMAAIAQAKMPIDGLSFGDGVVLLNGLPIEQASQAQKIGVSVAIAAALNPRLRFVSIKEASLLDDESWALLGKLAVEQKVQIIAETVSSNRPTAVLTEDGHVASRKVLEAAE